MKFPSRFLAVPLFLTLSAPALLAQVASQPPGATMPPSGQKQVIPSPLDAAENAIASQNYAAAAAQLDLFLSTHPTDARALFDRGYVAQAQNQIPKAISCYRKAIAADPKQFESRLALGLILASQGDDQPAIVQLQAATTLQPNPPNPAAQAQADRALARLLVHSNPVAARNALLSALKLTPETLSDAILTAHIAESAGDTALAEQAWQTVLQHQPGSVQATASLVHLLILQKQYSQADPLLHAALAKHPNNATLNAQLAAVLDAQGRQTEMLGILQKLHSEEPNNSAVTSMLADAELQAGQYAPADALYVQLLAASPKNTDYLDAHGRILIHQQHYRQALAAFNQVVAIHPGDVDAWSGIAYADSQLHNYTGEIQALSTRSKYAPENPSTLFLRATAYDNLHQTRAAVDYYQRFLAAANGKFATQEWQAKQRLRLLER